MKVLNATHRIRTFFKLKGYGLLYGKRFVHGKVSFRKNVNILIEKEGKLLIGEGCFFNNGCSINCLGTITIGENSIFGESVKIYDHNYHINTGKIYKESGHSRGKVVIGSNCWVGSNVVLLKGAELGNNVVIGAGCVINKKINDNTLVKLGENSIVEEQIIAK